jgi:hypothetical protein
MQLGPDSIVTDGFAVEHSERLRERRLKPRE